MADASVRALRLADVDAVVDLQLNTWQSEPAGRWAVPAVETLDPGAMRRAWERAVLLPPSPRHRALVALEGDRVVGIAAVVPADDPDLVTTADGEPTEVAEEVVLLLVDPPARGRGHGSRLLAAVADLAEQAGTQVLVTWLPAAADDARGFLEGAGWAADAAHRTVELDGHPGDVAGQEPTTPVRELRYATAIADSGAEGSA